MWRAWGVLASLPAVVMSLASTDSVQDADPAQSGYLPSHKMDPNVVAGSNFGIRWTFQSTNNKETWFAKPLTYTMPGGSEMVITASSMNWVRVFDSANGTLLAQRQLNPPFLQSDIGCYDIPDYIGVTGTPIIDPATNTIYVMAKGYKNGAASGGLANGIYQMYALALPSLTDAPGFPVLIDGHNADNDRSRYFVGGTVLQRPSLTTTNGVIVAAFGGHCDLFNYTGMLVSVSKTPGVGVVSIYAMEASPGAPSPQLLDLTVQKGGKAGIWQSGMGIATDGNRIFINTGNGQGHANGDVPASGRQPLNTLDEVVANFAVSSTGVFSLTDYFEPYDYVQMDAQDKDLGSSGTCLLDGSMFKTSTVNRIAVTVGKNGKVYVMNADNLGGFKQGSAGTDNVLQTITATDSVFGGAGSYPLEGGYFYFTPTGGYTYAYKMGVDSKGLPFFSQAGKTPTQAAGRAGVGQPTVTTYNGQAGTAILWITDVNNGLQAFRAVPDTNGVLQPIHLPATPGINKFQRPAFGDGRVFVTANSKLICLGFPVNLPINCTGPINFGDVQTGETKTMTISCKANIALTKVNGCSTEDKTFQCQNSSLPQAAVAAGTTFTFPVTWNLTQKSIDDAQNVSYGKATPGVESTVLDIYTTNGATGYSTDIPISLTGNVVSAAPFLFVSPKEVDFGGLVLGNANSANGLTGSVNIQNLGNSTLTFYGMAWQHGNDTSAQFHNLTNTGGSTDLGTGFSSPDFPQVSSTLAPGQALAVPLAFNSSVSGSYSVSVSLWSDGGYADILLAASAGNPPIATIAVSTLEGGWDDSEPVHMAFGNVLAGQTVTRKIQICNIGGSVLSITKSKPPSSDQLTAVSPYGELLEGQHIEVNTCANGSVAVYASPVQPNHPSQYISLVWTLNTDGLSAKDPTQPFGVHDVQTDVTIVSRQVGPVLGDGTARYQWVGCFQDTSVGRNLQTQVNSAAQQANNTNEQCQTLCYANGYALAGTEYQKECWCGNTVKYPQTYNNASKTPCTFSCPGDRTEACGGDGGFMSMYADTTKFDIQAFYASLNGGSTTTSSSSATGTATGTGTGTATGTTASPTTSSTGSPLNPNEPAVVNGQWNYIGCYKDNVNNVRSLSSASTAADTMTLEYCATYCSAYNFFGTEYGRECYCGYTLDTTLKGAESDCSTACKANTAELCGAGARLSIYNNTVYHTPPPSPSHVAQAGNYKWLGCYTEATAGRALSGSSYASDLMSIDSCASFCDTNSYKMMGVEYGRECYCGNSLGTGAALTATTDCKMLCKNNTLQYCGAGSRLDLYTFSPPSSTSSSSSSVNSIMSTTSSSFPVSTTGTGLLTSSGMTSTSSSSSSSGTTSSSSQLSSSSITSTSSISSSSTSSSSTSSSSSTISTTPSSVPSSSSTSTSSSSTSSSSSPLSSSSSSSSTSTSTLPASTPATTTPSSSSSSSSTFTGPTPTATNGYYYIGCFRDTDSGHALPQILANNSVTPELCINYANSVYSNAASPTTQLPYVYVEYHHECYGGATWSFQGSAVTSLTGTQACTDYCYGSVTTVTTNGVVSVTTGTANYCGGGKQFNLYALSPSVSFPTTGGPVVTSKA